MEVVMKVREAMTSDVCLTNPDRSIREAAQLMADQDIGALPVGEQDRLVGMVTDRDIAVRGVARGCGPDTPIREVMSQDVKYCFEDEDLDDVAHNMGDIKVRRLPVLNRDKRLVGIIAIGDLARCEPARELGQAVADISMPGGAHSQSAH
jgi:CBS domain-containing protein